ncbi:MAG: helix-turn-helix transcriptional regulator [Clostridiales bacterium]|nr:helix-turn-helix transcriptional regulator [Clostridiales bacterium]
MDQKLTGQFIAKIRKEKGLTQRQLAELLLISDKTVSKWETGGGLPEVSLMLPLCKILGITVNELLSAERISETEYKKKAEENLMNLIEERKENKRKLWLEVVIMVITLLGGTTIILLASYFEMAIGWRIALICIGVAIMVGGISVMCVLELSAGGYQCQKCKAKFVPSFGAYIMGAHTIMYRRLKCPKCGVRNWCKRTLTLGDVEEEPENKEE